MKRTLPTIAVLVILIVNSMAAYSQTRRKTTLKTDVPFGFTIGSRVFPAGTYTFEIATGAPRSSDQSAVLVVRGAERRLYAAVATGIVSLGDAPVGHKLEFVRNGDSHAFIQSLAAG